MIIELLLKLLQAYVCVMAIIGMVFSIDLVYSDYVERKNKREFEKRQEKYKKMC